MDPSTGINVLLVEDNRDDARFVQRLLVDHINADDVGEGVGSTGIGTVDHVESLNDALDHVDPGSTGIILLDLELPDSSGMETVETMVNQAPTIPVVVLTGRTGAGTEAIRRGAQDYLLKGTITMELLRRTIRYAIERARVTRELRKRNQRLALANEIIRTDLRTDLSVIVGLGDQLRDRVDDEDRETIEQLLEASQHVLELADTTADLVNVLSETSAAKGDRVDLRVVLESEFERLRNESNAELAVDWRVSDGQAIAVAGGPMLGLVFEHLLTNAATDSERETSRVAVTVEGTDDAVTVSIADDGVGISDIEKELLNDPEQRYSDHAVMDAELYLVTTVLERIGAEIKFADNYPRGTEVTVTLDRVVNNPS